MFAFSAFASVAEDDRHRRATVGACRTLYCTPGACCQLWCVVCQRTRGRARSPAPLAHLQRDWGSPLPHLRRDWAHPGRAIGTIVPPSHRSQRRRTPTLLLQRHNTTGCNAVLYSTTVDNAVLSSQGRHADAAPACGSGERSGGGCLLGSAHAQHSPPCGHGWQSAPPRPAHVAVEYSRTSVRAMHAFSGSTGK